MAIMSKLVELCGLWTSTDKNNEPVLSGKLGNAKVFIFKNTYKEGNQPDYRLYVSAPTIKEKEEENS